MLPIYVAVTEYLDFSVWCLRNVCFIVMFIEYFKLLVSQKNNVCVCVRARACVPVHCYLLLSIFAFVIERFFSSCSIELLMFYSEMYWMFYVNDEPEGKFLYTETIKLYCVVL